MFTYRDLSSGQMSRDMTLYVDADGRAYHIYSSEENLTLQIACLTDDYTDYTGRYVRVAPAGHNEAPALFRHKGKYYMITCSHSSESRIRFRFSGNRLAFGRSERIKVYGPVGVSLTAIPVRAAL